LPSGNVAAIDTGTTLIGGPSAAVSAVYAQIPGSQQLSGNLAGFYGFPCSTTVQVTMAFGGKSWPINSDDMNLGRVSTTSDICAGGIFDLNAGSSIGEGGGNPNWVVGDTFLKNVYSVFRSDPAAIGFAELSDTAGGSSGSPSNASGTPTSSSTSSSRRPSGTPTGGNNNNDNDGTAGTDAAASFKISSVVLLTTIVSLLGYLY